MSESLVAVPEEYRIDVSHNDVIGAFAAEDQASIKDAVNRFSNFDTLRRRGIIYDGGSTSTRTLVGPKDTLERFFPKAVAKGAMPNFHFDVPQEAIVFLLNYPQFVIGRKSGMVIDGGSNNKLGDHTLAVPANFFRG